MHNWCQTKYGISKSSKANALKQPLNSRWRKRSIQTESSSLPCFIKSWTKSKSIWMKVWQRKIHIAAVSYVCSLQSHHDALLTLQTTQTTLTGLSAPTRPSHASPIWWTWRRKVTLTWIITTSPDLLTSIPEYSQICRWPNTARMRVMPGCWWDLQSLKCE